MNKSIITIYTFRLNPDTSEQDFLLSSDALQAYFASSDGFLYRSLSQTAEGAWVDISYWRDEIALGKIDETFDKSADCQNFVAHIDKASLSVERSKVFAMGACAESQAA